MAAEAMSRAVVKVIDAAVATAVEVVAKVMSMSTAAKVSMPDEVVVMATATYGNIHT